MVFVKFAKAFHKSMFPLFVSVGMRAEESLRSARVFPTANRGIVQLIKHCPQTKLAGCLLVMQNFFGRVNKIDSIISSRRVRRVTTFAQSWRPRGGGSIGRLL